MVSAVETKNYTNPLRFRLISFITPFLGGFLLRNRLKSFRFSPTPLNTNSLSRLLARSGLILLGLYLVVVLFDVLPPKLLQPDWILSFAVSLSNSISIPLVGIVLVHLAGYLAPAERMKLHIRVARFAAILSLLFLFMQPMLAFAVLRNYRDLTDFNNEQIILIKTKGAQLNQAIRQSNTFVELQSSMARLQGPAIPDQARALPLGELKAQLLAAVKNAQAAFPARLNTPTSPAYREIYKRIARTSLMCLFGTFAFGLLAWNPITDKNILFSYLQSVGLFGITPASIYRSIKTFLVEYQDRRRQDSQVQVNRKSALRHQQQSRKVEAQQMREQKRRLLAEHKQAEKMRQERERVEELERKMERRQELERERQRRGE